MANITSHLKKLSKEELIKEIQQLNRDFSVVRDFFVCKFDADDDKILDKYKKVVKNEFFPTRGLGKMRLSVARKAVLDYKKISQSEENIADIMLYYVENGIKFTNEYGDIDESFYYSMGAMFWEALKYISEHSLLENFQSRAKQTLIDTEHIGWGFHDELEEYHRKYYKN